MAEETAPVVEGNADAPKAPDNAKVETKVDPVAPKTTSDDWRSGFSEDIRTHASIAKFDSGPESLAKSYINLEKMLGGDKVAIPKSMDDKENWDKVYKAIGRPDDAKGYEFLPPEGLPEGMEYPQETEDSFREKAHELGLSQTQAQDLRAWFLDSTAKGAAAGETNHEAKMAATMEELRKEWGAATPQKLDAASHAAKTLFGDDFVDALVESGFGNDVRVLRGFARIADKVGGDKSLIGEALTESTPGDLKASIAEFRGTHASALNDKYHIEHKTRVKELQALYNKAYPEPAA